MRVLLVEDSRTVRAYIEAALRGAPDIELLAPIFDGQTAVLVAQAARPDIILMDLVLPGLDGVTAIAEIMASEPCPIVVLSAHLSELSESGRDRAFDSLSAGAVDVLAKPQALTEAAFTAFRERLLKTLRLMKDARVVRRRARGPGAASSGSFGAQGRAFGVVAIGSSTGGPPLLYELLRSTPAPYPLPILIAQHVLRGFAEALAAWLGKTGHAVQVAHNGARLRPGAVYLLPPETPLSIGLHALALPPGGIPAPREPVGAEPSVDALFQGVAAAFGARTVAILLTGMGSDGAQGLLRLRQAGALTATQSAESCLIDGMPAAARALGAALYDLSPRELCGLLARVAAPHDAGVPRSRPRLL